VILREFQTGESDPAVLASFACSTGLPFEDEVEQWIRATALAWVNDLPRASFQRRALELVVDDAGDTVAVAAWQDITRIDVEGIWLEVIAVGLDYQHRGTGREVLEATMAHLRGIDRDGDRVAGLVHPDNARSKRLLSAAGFTNVAMLDDHELWLGTL
jgi:RimJ/RimL family protein N-acetyltransferase